jgi:hypothetical protein
MADLNDPITTRLLKKSGGKTMRVVKIPKPEKTWFIQQPSGRIFACNELEAWHLAANKDNQWTQRGNRILGVGSGEIYAAGLIEASKITIESLVKDKKKLKTMKESKQIEMVNEAVKERILKAEADELEACRGHIEHPRSNLNVLALDGKVQTNKKVLDSGMIE